MKRIAWITVGRLKYLEIQYKYLLRNLKSVNKFIYCIQRCGPAERDFVKKIVTDRPYSFDSIEIKKPHENSSSVSNILRHPAMHQDDTLYIKIDDDVIFIEDGTFEDVFNFKESCPETSIVYPNIINNIITNYLHQRRFVYDRNRGTATWHPFCDIGWRCGNFAQHVHETFLHYATTKNLDIFKFPPFRVTDYQRISINMICYSGKSLKEHLNEITDDCEMSMAEKYTRAIGHPPIIHGQKLVSHFSYFTQEEYLLTQGHLLDGYRKLADNYTGVS